MAALPPDSELQLRMSALSAGLRERDICVLHQGSDRRFDLAENVPPIWGQTNLIERRVADIWPADIAQDFDVAHDRCRDTGSEQHFDFSMGEGLARRQFEAHMATDATGILTIITDVTDTRTREAAVASLLREVSHRSKNLLAIVQSVAMQTAHHSGGIRDFLDKFRGRLHALSSTQDLVTESDWRGTYLQSLIVSQLTRIGSSLLANVRVTGDNPLLGPNAALHIGLALHELGANAVLHGTLADTTPGHVWIDAHLEHEPGQPDALVIEWQETAIDAERLRHEPHFGTLVLERIVPLSVGGSARFSVEPDGVRYRLVVPADQFEA